MYVAREVNKKQKKEKTWIKRPQERPIWNTCVLSNMYVISPAEVGLVCADQKREPRIIVHYRRGALLLVFVSCGSTPLY